MVSSLLRPATPRTSRGMVTVEIALGTLSVLMLLVSIGWMLGALTQQVRCADVAAEVARHEARGDAAAVRRAQSRAPAKARVTSRRDGGQVTTEVSVAYQPVPVAPPITLRARSVVLLEPGE